MLDNITQQQLRDVYTGKITSWRELGADNDLPINLYARDGKISGVEHTMRQLLFNNPDQDFTSRAKWLPSSGKIEEAVEKGSIRYGSKRYQQCSPKSGEDAQSR